MIKRWHLPSRKDKFSKFYEGGNIKVKFLIILLIIIDTILAILAIVNMIRLKKIKQKTKEKISHTPKLSNLHGKDFSNYIYNITKDLK